jgi:hypothetical protein
MLSIGDSEKGLEAQGEGSFHLGSRDSSVTQLSDQSDLNHICKTSGVKLLVLQMRKLRLREVKQGTKVAVC